MGTFMFCARPTLMFPLLNQVNQSVPDVHRQAVVGHSDLLLLQIDGEHGFVGDGQLAPLLLSQDGHPAGSHDGVLVPHQLHSGQIWVQREKVEESGDEQRVKHIIQQYYYHLTFLLSSTFVVIRQRAQH